MTSGDGVRSDILSLNDVEFAAEFVIGTHRDAGRDNFVAYGALADSLKQSLPGYNFSVQSYGCYEAMAAAIASREVDIAEVGAVTFASIVAEDPDAATPLLTPISPDGTSGYFSLGITLVESTITIEELTIASEPITIGVVNTLSTSGFLAPLVELRELGIDLLDPPTNVTVIRLGTHGAVIKAVADGTIDLGFTWARGDAESGWLSGALPEAVANNAIELEDVNVVWQSNPLLNGPIVVSTDVPNASHDALAAAIETFTDANTLAAEDMFGGAYDGLTEVNTEDYQFFIDLERITIGDNSSEGSLCDNTLSGGAGNDTLYGGAGNDVITASKGNDTIDGGDGTDTVSYDGDQDAYTVTLGPSGVQVRDRRPDGNGTDTLTNIEFLEFDTGDFANFNLEQFGGATSLSEADFKGFIELYIAYFNRAPDAVGLNFWGTAFANGTTMEQMAKLFAPQDETLNTYPEGTSNTEFATAVYNNVLGKTPDQAGFDFWVGVLDEAAVTRDQFILEVLRGVQNGSTDRGYLDNKVDVGAYFAVHKGLSDTGNAAAAMQLYDGTEASIQTVKQAIDAYHLEAMDPVTGKFLLPLVGVLDDPFV